MLPALRPKMARSAWLRILSSRTAPNRPADVRPTVAQSPPVLPSIYRYEAP